MWNKLRMVSLSLRMSNGHKVKIVANGDLDNLRNFLRCCPFNVISHPQDSPPSLLNSAALTKPPESG